MYIHIFMYIYIQLRNLAIQKKSNFLDQFQRIVYTSSLTIFTSSILEIVLKYIFTAIKAGPSVSLHFSYLVF